MGSTKQLIDLYVYRKEKNHVYFLLMQRAKEKIYSGQWRMIGGKTQEGEKRWQTALRELKEETGLTPDLFWTVPTLNHFYEPESDQTHLIPAFAAEVAGNSEITLNDEHVTFKWLPIGDIPSYLYWPEQVRIIHCINELVINDKLLTDWIIETDHT